mmetsp:Transcript_25063/g.34430  ORF Transcript_25063/g.34430 Transcript_25063/m.34430 type:complete len:121 (+) Transcript_25063:57-419(+)
MLAVAMGFAVLLINVVVILDGTVALRIVLCGNVLTVRLGQIKLMRQILHIKARSVQIMDFAIGQQENVNVSKVFLGQLVKERIVQEIVQDMDIVRVFVKLRITTVLIMTPLLFLSAMVLG